MKWTVRVDFWCISIPKSLHLLSIVIDCAYLRFRRFYRWVARPCTRLMSCVLIILWLWCDNKKSKCLGLKKCPNYPSQTKILEGRTNISECIFEALFKGVSTRFGRRTVEKCFENAFWKVCPAFRNLRLGGVKIDSNGPFQNLFRHVMAPTPCLWY